jgi:hypothetical protein
MICRWPCVCMELWHVQAYMSDPDMHRWTFQGPAVCGRSGGPLVKCQWSSTTRLALIATGCHCWRPLAHWTCGFGWKPGYRQTAGNNTQYSKKWSSP